jgi:hypothetical protein
VNLAIAFGGGILVGAAVTLLLVIAAGLIAGAKRGEQT